MNLEQCTERIGDTFDLPLDERRIAWLQLGRGIMQEIIGGNPEGDEMAREFLDLTGEG